MLDLQYSLRIEATDDPRFFSSYSDELQGFSGVGNSVEDCLSKAKCGMDEHVALLREENFPVPAANPNPEIVIRNARSNRAA